MATNPVYPAYPKPSYSDQTTPSFSPQWNTVISQFDSGREQRRQKLAYAIYNIYLVYNALTAPQMQILYDFFMQCYGAYSDFMYYTFDVGTPGQVSWHDIYVGVGDGVISTFNIPGKNTGCGGTNPGSVTVYVGGGSPTPTSFSAGTGIYGEDQFTLASAPAAGSIIACDFGGNLRIHARFASDAFGKSGFAYNRNGYMWYVAVTLQGLTPKS